MAMPVPGQSANERFEDTVSSALHLNALRQAKGVLEADGANVAGMSAPTWWERGTPTALR